jgi:histidine ammonia-lyase
MKLQLDGTSLTLENLARIARGEGDLQVAVEALERMARSRKVVEEVLRTDRVVYGVNTGFGKLSDVRIPSEDLKTLQKNLILSHACGTGPALSAPETRALLALKINALLSGYSGARPVIVEYLLKLLQHEVLPVIPEQGSVGASGDLAPLVLIGEGEAEMKGRRVSGAEALRAIGLPALDQLRALQKIFTIEINAATDNPLVFVEDRSNTVPSDSRRDRFGEILSGGNFHGHPISTACDFLAILVTHLANISERRLAAMMDPAVSELPAFLVKNSGLNSGSMIAQVAAASLVSENKVLSHPASVDSIPTSANKEDYVSMGAVASVKARNAGRNATQVLAIELLAACQALDLRAPLQPGPATGAVRNLVRQVVPMLVNDRILANDVAAASRLIESGEVVRAAERVVGEL